MLSGSLHDRGILTAGADSLLSCCPCPNKLFQGHFGMA
ncbi:hypothetical protein AB434_3807 [Heyndrickxia coagulans]|uniref:Uncharacterized protein n=1 Tax=Heyndrickxia coagulans TaxID=1398 RepID=A0AAN0T519_HEYCO|nr:hypothetical protein SB48_HM08orf02303 [Heyndrickxia coagulans]AKN56212.1 hypothetical protein AB434_3807 [Heyndrickxia coagulans]